MFSQVDDFAAECRAFSRLIHEVLLTHGNAAFDQPTQFKQWSLNDILRHLHVWNQAVDTSLHQPEAFQTFLGHAASAFQGGDMREFERQWLKGLEGEDLCSAWLDFAEAMSQRFHDADPAVRVQWAGPPMSLRSAVSARLMETWAHAQAVFDEFGAQRTFTDRLESIVILGVNTYSWTYKNRGMTPPQPMPQIHLESPSGKTWHYGEADSDNITGQAADFCQVVTQVRHVQDTALKVVGDTALQWMNMAQCFAGAPVNPPAPGLRFRKANVT